MKQSNCNAIQAHFNESAIASIRTILSLLWDLKVSTCWSLPSLLRRSESFSLNPMFPPIENSISQSGHMPRPLSEKFFLKKFRAILWHHVKNAKKKFIFITWIFKYKFDNEKYLIKYKIKLCVRKNFQQIEQNVYVVTLIIKNFWTLIIIITIFDFNIR